MARLVEAGCEVRYVAFSIATRSLPAGFPPDTLAREVREATAELGIPESHLTVHDFDVRTFPERRQDILELLVALWEEWKPDVVFQPSHHDVHQDHQTVAQEGLRAFKRTTILGYEIPWNNYDFSYGAYVGLEQRHLERKIAAVEKLRLPAAPPLRERRVHLEPGQGARHEREPRARRGVPGVPHRRVAAGRAPARFPPAGGPTRTTRAPAHLAGGARRRRDEAIRASAVRRDQADAEGAARSSRDPRAGDDLRPFWPTHTAHRTPFRFWSTSNSTSIRPFFVAQLQLRRTRLRAAAVHADVAVLRACDAGRAERQRSREHTCRRRSRPFPHRDLPSVPVTVEADRAADRVPAAIGHGRGRRPSHLRRGRGRPVRARGLVAVSSSWREPCSCSARSGGGRRSATRASSRCSPARGSSSRTWPTRCWTAIPSRARAARPGRPGAGARRPGRPRQDLDAGGPDRLLRRAAPDRVRLPARRGRAGGAPTPARRRRS